MLLNISFSRIFSPYFFNFNAIAAAAAAAAEVEAAAAAATGGGRLLLLLEEDPLGVIMTNTEIFHIYQT
jgi:hypothetical protein